MDAFDRQIAKNFIPQIMTLVITKYLKKNWRGLVRRCLNTDKGEEALKEIYDNSDLSDENKVNEALTLIADRKHLLTWREFKDELERIECADLAKEFERVITPEEFTWKFKPPPAAFIGRLDLLKEFYEMINDSPIIAVTGIPGTGKTAFTSKVTEEIRKNFQCIIWIDSKVEILIAELHSICKHLCLIEKDEVVSVADAMLKLKAYFCEKRTLFVFDNLQFESQNILECFSKNPKHRTIINSQYCIWPQDVTEIKLPSLTEVEAVSYFNKCFQKSISFEEELKLKLVKKLGNSPLALKISTSYIEDMMKENITNPLKKYLEEFHPNVLNDLTIANSNLLSSITKNLEKLDEDPLELARFLSFVGKSASMDFIEDVHEFLIPSKNKNPTFKVMRNLKSYSIIEFDGEGYSMHDLIVMAIHQKQQINNDIINKITEYMKIKLNSNEGYFWTKHFCTFIQTDFFKFSEFSGVEPAIAKIMCQNGLANKCLSLLEKQQNTSNENYLIALADCYHYLGKYKEELSIRYRNFLRICARRMKAIGNNDPETLRSRHDIARSLLRQGEYADALTIFKDVLEGQKQTIGNNHPDTLSTRNNISVCLMLQGEYAEEHET